MNEQKQTACKSEGFSVGFSFVLFVLILGRSSQILKSKQCNPLICDIKEGHKASTQTKFH